MRAPDLTETRRVNSRWFRAPDLNLRSNISSLGSGCWLQCALAWRVPPLRGQHCIRFTRTDWREAAPRRPAYHSGPGRTREYRVSIRCGTSGRNDEFDACPRIYNPGIQAFRPLKWQEALRSLPVPAMAQQWSGMESCRRRSLSSATRFSPTSNILPLFIVC